MQRAIDIELITRRLTLRPPRRADAVPLARLIGDWDVVKMLGQPPYPYEERHARAWIADIGLAMRNGREHAFVVELPSEPDAGPVGVVGLQPRGTVGTRELGYWIGRPYWGLGYMTEAAGRVVRFGFEELALSRITSGHYVDNPASGRVLQKLGFRDAGAAERECVARGAPVASCEFELTRAEWMRAA